MTVLRKYTALCFTAVFVIACSSITDMQLPDGTESPAMYNNREGAVRLTQSAERWLSAAVSSYIVTAGLLTDELTYLATDANATDGTDRREIGNNTRSPVDETLHTLRAYARQARGVVSKYVSGETSAWQAQLLIYEAYAEILLADGWCSGIPLSTLDFEGDWTYRSGSTTEEVYEHAIQLLDSAYERDGNNPEIQNAAALLKARALLAMGKYTEAGLIAQGIDPKHSYKIRIAFDNYVVEGESAAPFRYNRFVNQASISDKEGVNGLPFLTSRDPRTEAVQVAAGRNANTIYAWFPAKYITSDSSDFILTSGIEARLILAEVALKDNDYHQFSTILNSLRTNGTYSATDTTYSSDNTEVIDTLWNAGIGGFTGLGPLIDPGSLDGRLRLIFAERASWLFATGSRQGDLRRLVRNYGWSSEDVYPTGIYQGPGFNDSYGTDTFFRISNKEFTNPHFEGCKE